MSKLSSGARKRAHRIRTERFLSGGFNGADANALLSYLRDKSRGNAVVKELGDFAAHADSRNKGLVTEAARDFFVILRHTAPRLMNPNPHDRELPISFPEWMKASFRVMSVRKIEAALGMKHREICNSMESAIAKYKPGPSGTLQLTQNLTKAEAAVIRHLASHVEVKPVFTEESIMDGLTSALLKEGLIFQSEAAAFRALRPQIMVFLVALVHQAEIDLGDGTRAEIWAGFDNSPDRFLTVGASAPVAFGDGRSVNVVSPIFATNIKASDYCDPSLVLEEHGGAHWSCPIEVGPDGRLRELVAGR